MTEPCFDARCYPGFLASYGGDSFWGLPENPLYNSFNDNFCRWIDENCLGPVRMSPKHVAHWASQVEFSHPHDLMLYRLTSLDNNVSESLNCNETGPREFDDTMVRDVIYVGKNVDKDFLREFLDKYPYKVVKLSKRK